MQGCGVNPQILSSNKAVLDCTDCNGCVHSFQVIVSSEGKAAIWQNKRTGLFSFAGEHNGRPLYRNQATKEYLFYTLSGSEWLVGPDFRKNNAGIQVE